MNATSPSFVWKNRTCYNEKSHALSPTFYLHLPFCSKNSRRRYHYPKLARNDRKEPTDREVLVKIQPLDLSGKKVSGLALWLFNEELNKVWG